MPLAPIFSSSCDLANRLPSMIAEFLDIEQHLKRRFREDSITDILIASLLTLPGNDIVVLTPPEPETGSDFDIVIVTPSTSEAVQFRIQAKRLTPHKHNWMLGSYVELAHPHNSGAQSQALIRSLGKEKIFTIPLYAFYNPAHVCAASGNAVSGIELASAWEVRERIKIMVRMRPKRIPLKRVGLLQPIFFPISTILCPTSTSTQKSLIPLPEEARSAVISAIEKRSQADEFNTFINLLKSASHHQKISGKQLQSEGSDRYEQSRVALDENSDKLPKIIRRAVDRRQERIITARVKRPKILLISNK